MINAAIYKDEGVAEFTFNAMIGALQSFDIECECINAQDVLAGALNACDLFVMPGGADEPYHAKLGNKGADIIRAYVRAGGAYFGSCAGAYYACDRFEFNKGLASEIIRDRPLKLFKGWARGSVLDFAPPYDLTLSSACLTSLKMGEIECDVYYHGGPVFLGFENDPDANIIGNYTDLPANQNAAVIYKKFGEGRMILCSPHIEVDALDFEKRLHQENDPQPFASILNGLQDFSVERRVFLEKMLALLLP